MVFINIPLSSGIIFINERERKYNERERKYKQEKNQENALSLVVGATHLQFVCYVFSVWEMKMELII